MERTERTLRRKEEIEAALLELMHSTSYQQITVTDLTKHLDVARKSFYYYFPSKDACFESLVDRLIQESALHVSRKLTDDQQIVQIYEENLRFWICQKPFLDLVIKNNLGHILLARTMHHIRQEEKLVQTLLRTPSVEFDEDILLFYVTGHQGLLLNWCAQNFTLSVEEMARKYLRLMHTPLLSLDKQAGLG